MMHFLSLEEKKGSDQFDPITYSIFIVHLEKLLKDKREGAQRLACEIVAGLVNGSKLWVFEKLAPVLEWLKPRLSFTLENMSNESERNWGTSIATIYGTCEARQLGWLTDLLFCLIEKPTDNSFHMTTRLYLIHCALNQMEWRIPQQWRKLYQHCSPLVGHTYQNMRYRVGSCLASTSLCDLKGIFVDLELRPFLNLVSVDEILSLINTELESTGLWSTVIQNGLGPASSEITKNKSPANGLIQLEPDSNGNKKGKLILITLVNTLYSLSSQSSHSINPALIRLIPILAHYSNESNEEELKSSCQIQLIRSMGTSYVTEAEISLLFDVCNMTISKCCWWKTKMTLLRFLQVFIFSNIFAMSKCKDKVRELVLTLMTDAQLDVRVASADTLSGFIHCSYIAADNSLMEIVRKLAASKDPIEQHAGVLSLSAIIQAFPYSVPDFLPEMLMALCKHAHDPQPNYGTVKKALSEFKRTHQDCWHEHKQEFSEEQLTVLTDLLVSPNYYV
uniref:Proteasome activator complex subunit 4 C-terminal domain-containing protein n=1 Tax=Ditylenchus dipsaci TaxID=166011 RepID=A0A915D6A4_9BILA